MNCSNYNHSRRHPPVRGCPNCGEIVNGDIPVKVCPSADHAKRRRNGDRYCIDCGEQLRSP